MGTMKRSSLFPKPPRDASRKLPRAHMTTTLLKRHRTLLKAFLHSSGITVVSLATPDMLSRGRAQHAANGADTLNGGTLLALQAVLNAKLCESGQVPVSLDAVRYMLFVQPAPEVSMELLRATEKA